MKKDARAFNLNSQSQPVKPINGVFARLPESVCMEAVYDETPPEASTEISLPSCVMLLRAR